MLCCVVCVGKIVFLGLSDMCVECCVCVINICDNVFGIVGYDVGC